MPRTVFDRHKPLAPHRQKSDQITFGDEKSSILIRLELPDLRTCWELITDIALGTHELAGIGVARISSPRGVQADAFDCSPKERRLLLA